MDSLDLYDIKYTRYQDANDWTRDITANYINIIHLNIRSLRKQFNQLLVLLHDCIVKRTLNIIVLTEVNIKKEEVSLYMIPGYLVFPYTREMRRGGGILVYVRDDLQYTTEIPRLQYKSAEIIHGKLRNGKNNMHILAIYRPPHMIKQNFITEIDTTLKNIPLCEEIILIGDINIDLFHGADSQVIAYKTMLCDNGLQSAIPTTATTREAIVDGRVTSSNIDHVCVRAERARPLDARAHLLMCTLSDHYIVGISLTAARNVNVNNSCYSKTVLNEKTISVSLKTINWAELLEISCPLLLYEKLYSIFASIYEKSKMHIISKGKRITQPWVNSVLRKKLKYRDSLFRIWKSAPNNMNNRLIYTRYRNKVNKLVNIAKNKYRQNQIEKCYNDFRKIWSIVNTWTGKQKTRVDDVIIKYLGKTDTILNICNKFSNVFTGEIQKIKHNCDNYLLDRSSYVTPSNVTFYFKKVDANLVEKYINKLNNNKAPGLDMIRVQDIKTVKKEISPIIAKFVNMCVSEGVYPSILKKSIIRPIFKHGNHLDYSNYRPIAILSVINKIVEKIIVNQMSNFLEKHNIISDAQHGFRRGRSTSTALAQFTDYVNNRLNEGKFVAAIFIDYKKAFDTLEHDVLLQAMQECGIRGPVNRWFKCYLENRHLCTTIDGTTGDDVSVTLGVPTGSVFGPVGYIMHVNCVINVIKYCKVFMYADDMCLLYSCKDSNVAQTYLQTDFESIIKWAHDNGIIINHSKTKSMQICSPYSNYAKQKMLNIKITGHTYECLHNNKDRCLCENIQIVEHYRYLGLLVDCHFSWKLQVNDVCSKLQSVLGKFFHLSGIINRKTMYMLYYALADSIITYCLSSYGLTFKTYLDRIKQLQIRLLKYLVTKKTKLKCKPHYEKLFKICKIIPVHMKVEYLIAIEQFHINKYKDTRSHKYSTKLAKKGKYVIPSITNYYGKRTRQYLTPVIYNKIDMLRSIAEDTSMASLKRKLKCKLLENKK